MRSKREVHPSFSDPNGITVEETPSVLNIENKLKSERFKNRFGSIYNNVDKERKASLTYILVFLLRRAYLAVVIAFIPLSAFQFMAIQASSVAVLVYYLTLKPMETPIYNSYEIINESFIYTCAVIMVLFTDYVTETDARWVFGYSFIGITIACISVNLFLTLIVAVYAVKGALRKRKMKKEVQAALKQAVDIEEEGM